MKIIFIIFLILGILPAFSAESDLEGLQSAFIEKMINYVEWPNSTSQFFTIAVISHEAIFNKMRSMENKVILGKSVRVIHLDKMPKKSEFEILIAKTSNEFKSLNQGLMVVTEDPNGLGDYATINFFLEDGKLRFDINQSAANGSGLKINSRLLKLARTLK